MTPLLKKAPTLLVIGVTGFVAYTVLVPDGDSSPPKAEPKPSTTNKVVTATTAEALRNPFRMKQSEDAEAATNATAASPGSNDRRKRSPRQIRRISRPCLSRTTRSSKR